MRKNNRLPNLKNLGVLLRILLIVNALGLLAAILLSNKMGDFLPLLAKFSMQIQPVLLVSILLLYLLHPSLVKLSYWQGIVAIMLIVVGVTTSVIMLFTTYFTFDAAIIPYRSILLAGVTTAIVIYYFNLQQRAYSPAIAEARLQALQARIRPHFLFNSINAVLSLIRNQPKIAETALEDMTDLFRVLMSENRDLVPLKKEIALCKQYLSIESLRMGDRLTLNWQIDGAPADALIPPLILQPLLENAVYHGIEPCPEGGTITVIIEHRQNELVIKMSNPCHANNSNHEGNKMALKNIKERLALHFDLEASIKHRTVNQQYTVTIRLPYQIS